MSYLVVSPCRNESKYLERTLQSMAAQTVRPSRWVIVDDGSTDKTPEMLAAFAAEHPWVTIVQKPNRGFRAVGPGVIEAFYFGLDTVDMDDFAYLTKLDLDLDLPPRYFETLIARMRDNPRIGTASGKPYFRGVDGQLHSERRGDEMSVGMTKFYRTACFKDIGGFVREVMWDGIDCHKCRQKGWIAISWDEPDLRFEHLRPMGSSQKGILTGRARHGYGQYFMGSDPLYFLATAIFRMRDKPYVIGGAMTVWGYIKAWVQNKPKLDDPDLRRFIRDYQRRALFVGKHRATAEVDGRSEPVWRRTYAG